MSSPDQLALSPTDMEAASAQLTNDAAEAQATADLMSLIGTPLGEPEVGLSVRSAMLNLGRAFSEGFTTVATELGDLATQVSGSARLAVLVDNNVAGYFTPSDAI